MAKTAAIIALATGLMACNLALVGGPEPTSCELAAQHVAGCLGYDHVEVTTSCDTQATAQADAVLQKQCNEIAPANERSTMFLKDLLCKFLPFLCPSSNNNPGGNPGNPGNPGQVGQGDISRIGDCWRDPQHGFCYDIVKVNPQNNCTVMLEKPEWQLQHYTHYECRDWSAERCRLVRVCQQFKDKGQCINDVPHHADVPKCQAEQPPEQPPEHPQQPPSNNGCNNDSECGGGICTWDHTCVPFHSQGIGSPCRASDGSFRGALCHQGLVCKVNIAPSHMHGECVH